MTKRALITGVTGQDGLYLSELLLDEGLRGLRPGPRAEQPEAAAAAASAARRQGADRRPAGPVQPDARVLGRAQPDEVYNLGAISFVAYSWENAHLTSDVTGKGVLNMLEATRLHAGDDIGKVRFYQASSSRCSARCSRSRSARTTLLWPRSPYGVAKVFGHYMTINYRESYGMHASLGDPVQPRVAPPRAGVRHAQGDPGGRPHRLGLQEQVALGNLDAQRDWGFAGDYVKAMWLMLQQDEADDYVVATGETHSIRELLDVAFAHVGIDDWDARVVQDPRFLRPAEVDLLIGDPAKAASPAGLGARGRLRGAGPR